MPYFIGLDIGTTSISATVINQHSHRQEESFTIPYHYPVSCDEPDFCQQDPSMILAESLRLLDQILAKYSKIQAIGLTGQMHGILYVDQNGRAVSPLMNWQDQRAGRFYDSQQTYCDRIHALTGEKIAPGYGLATHFYNLQNALVPETAHSFCSIMDYVGMGLTGRSIPLMHTSVAASFGLFDHIEKSFLPGALTVLGMTDLILPEVTDDYALLGYHLRIPVSVAIGDNQASFLGSMKDLTGSVLVNMGTGSQISTLAGSPIPQTNSLQIGATEIRPLIKDKNIICGSALCGGASYALLEQFFRSYQTGILTAAATPEASGTDIGPGSTQAVDSQFDTMNRLAYEAYRTRQTPLTVNTYFGGQRHNPAATGSILGITTENFTPGQLILGFLYGMCRELYELLQDHLPDKKTIVASGNAIQRITVLKSILEEIFGLPVLISGTSEEAALGAALFGAVCTKLLQGPEDFAAFIHYDAP